MGDAFGELMKDMQMGGKPFVPRTRIEMLMPMMRTLLQQLAQAAANPFGANFDPDAALATMTQELAEISTAPIKDAVFEVPAGYQSASVARFSRR